MNDRGERAPDASSGAQDDDDVLADAHVRDEDVVGDELGGGLGNTADGGANDG